MKSKAQKHKERYEAAVAARDVAVDELNACSDLAPRIRPTVNLFGRVTWSGECEIIVSNAGWIKPDDAVVFGRWLVDTFAPQPEPPTQFEVEALLRDGTNPEAA